MQKESIRTLISSCLQRMKLGGRISYIFPPMPSKKGFTVSLVLIEKSSRVAVRDLFVPPHVAEAMSVFSSWERAARKTLRSHTTRAKPRHGLRGIGQSLAKTSTQKCNLTVPHTKKASTISIDGICLRNNSSQPQTVTIST